MATLVSTIRGAFHYRGREGQLAWAAHRLSGLGTLLFFVLHVLDTSTLYFLPGDYDIVIKLYQSLPFQFGEILLVGSVIYHAMNGFRVILLDWRPSLWKHQRVLTLSMFAVSMLMFIPAVIIMGGHAIENLGLFE